MAEIVIVKQNPVEISEADRLKVRETIFGIIDGLGDVNRKAWRRFWNRLFKAEPGELFEINTYQERLGWWHRKHMAMEAKLFEAQERFETFEQFRCWLKIGAGYCDWVPGPKGAIIPIPKSISYRAIDQGGMEEVHQNMIDFLRSHGAKVLWPKLVDHQRELALEAVLAPFGQFAE